MFKVPPPSVQIFIDTPNCVLEDRVQYSMVHIPNVFCDGHLQLINYVGIVRQVHRDLLITLFKICKYMQQNVYRCECADVQHFRDRVTVDCCVDVMSDASQSPRVEQHGPWWLHQLLPSCHTHTRDLKMCVSMTSLSNTWSWSHSLRTFEMFECGSSPEQTPLHPGHYSAALH